LSIVVGFFVATHLNKPKITENQYNLLKKRIEGLTSENKSIFRKLNSLQKETSKKVCFTSKNDPNYIKIRNEILSELAPKDIENWNKQNVSRRLDFISENDQYWCVGKDRSPSNRFNFSAAKTTRGLYKGKFSINLNDLEFVQKFSFDLSIKGFRDRDKSNKFSYVASDKSYKSSVSFKYALFGTNDKLPGLNLVFDNPDQKTSSKVSHFVFVIPSKMKAKKKYKTKVYGLDESLNWKAVGVADYKKIR